MLAIEVKTDFHPVGQGLFATGTLRRHSTTRPVFRWVYDCGTTSEQQYVRRAITRLEAEWNWPVGPTRRIDMFVLSHFDHDHLSGLTTLLSKFSIGAIVLPYVPLWHRLVLAFDEGVAPKDEEMRFFLNPSDYLTRLPGGGINEIIFVPPSNPESSPPDGGAGLDPSPKDLDELRLNADRDESGMERKDDPHAFDITRAGTNTQAFLLRGARFTVAAAWEFVPYNDFELAPRASQSFRRTVARLRRSLLATSAAAERKSALKELKRTYDRTFGSDLKARNQISLFLYGGPILFAQPPTPPWRIETTLALQRFSKGGEGMSLWTPPRVATRENKCGILYTGDGYLDDEPRTDQLVQFLRNERIARIFTLQVMHHGARSNWHPGVSARLDPAASVFSSDPRHKKFRHAHRAVLRDFRHHGPVQVNKRTGFTAEHAISPGPTAQVRRTVARAAAHSARPSDIFRGGET